MPITLQSILLRRRFRPSPVPASAGSDFESALVARLKATAELAEIVGTRIFPLVVPQRTPPDLPRLVYAISANDRLMNLSGSAGVATARVHLDVRSPRIADCKRCQEVLRRFNGFRGVLAGDIKVLFTKLDDQADSIEWPDDGSGQETEHLTLSYFFKYRESKLLPP